MHDRKFTEQFIENGFDQFQSLPEKLPFKEDLTESFASLYMVLRDITLEIQEGEDMSIRKMRRISEEWSKINEIRQLAELVNDDDVLGTWEDAILDSYYHIFLVVKGYQDLFEQKFGNNE